MTSKKAPRKFLTPKLEHLGGKAWKCSWRGEDLVFDQFSSTRLLFSDVNYKYVIKVDHNPINKWQSRQTAREIEFWETLVEDKHHFAQILDYGRTTQGFWWLRQKWYTPDDEEKCTAQNLSTLNELIIKYDLADIHEVWQDGSGNWMVHKGEVLIYDWAGYKV